MNANEQFIVKHYSEDERPTIKGHGFDGLVIGDDRQEAQDFVDYLNTMLRQLQAENEALKAKLKKCHLKEDLDRNLNLIYGKELL